MILLTLSYIISLFLSGLHEFKNWNSGNRAYGLTASLFMFKNAEFTAS